MKSALKWLVVVVVLGLGGWFGYQKYKNRAPDPITYRTAAVDKGTISAQVTATGTLSALVTVEVGSQVSGRLTDIFVDYNSQVKKGQVLAKLDTQLLLATVQREQANLASSKGSVARSEAQLKNAERNLARTQALVEAQIGNAADLDTAISAYEAAKADLIMVKASQQQVIASLNTANINLSYATIYSPVDGVVISRAVDVGQTVAASLSAPTLFTIAGDLREMQVDTNVAEGDVGKLKAGLPANFTVDAYPSQTFKGTVRQIRNDPQNVSNVVTYDAVIDVGNPDLLLKPGMTANVRFIWSEKNDALRVPNAALRFKPPADAGAVSAEPMARRAPPAGADSAWAAGSGERPPRELADGSGDGERPAGSRGGEGSSRADGERRGGGAGRGTRGANSSDRKTVWVLRDGVPTGVNVRVGITDGAYTEILFGALKEGDEVILDAQVPESRKSSSSTSGSVGLPGASPAGGRGMGRVL